MPCAALKEFDFGPPIRADQLNEPESFKMMAGLNMLHVHYRGGAAAITDLIGGQVQVMIERIAGPIEHIRAGKLRGLATTTTTRSGALPNLPTLETFVPG